MLCAAQRASASGGAVAVKKYVAAGNGGSASVPVTDAPITLGEQKRQQRVEVLAQGDEQEQEEQEQEQENDDDDDGDDDDERKGEGKAGGHPVVARSGKSKTNAKADPQLAAMLAADNGQQLKAFDGKGERRQPAKKKGLTYSELKKQGRMDDGSGEGA